MQTLTKSDQFHQTHETLTKKIYQDTTMLPDRYVYVLTNRCNLRCSFCFQDKKERQDAMTLEDWKVVTDQLPDYARVTLTGGEPLIFKQFKEIFTYVSNRFNCNLITNGLLLNETMVSLLFSSPRFKVLSISIDNIGNTLREVSSKQWNGMVALLKKIPQLKTASQSSCILDIKTVVLDDNASDLFDIHRYCVEELGCQTHAFQFLKGSPLQHSDIMSSYSDIHKPVQAYQYQKFDMIRAQLEKIRQYNIASTTSSAFLHPNYASLDSLAPLPDLSILNQPIVDPSHFQLCKFPWSSVHINYDGNLFPCLAISYGNVKTHPLKEIFSSHVATCFKDEIRNKGVVSACNRCGWLRLKNKLNT